MKALEADGPFVAVKAPAPELDGQRVAPATDSVAGLETKAIPSQATIPAGVTAATSHIEATDGESETDVLIQTRPSERQQHKDIAALTVGVSHQSIADAAIEDVFRLRVQRELATLAYRGGDLPSLREEQVGTELTNEVAGTDLYGRQGSG